MLTTSPPWSKSPLAQKDSDLRALDFLALLAILGILLVLFREIERWLHQHIFKVGWLLTNNFQVTTILYYILFLPGILLHEITLWLAARILNLRPGRAIAFPAEQDIGELRLDFIRLSPGSRSIRYNLARLAPLAAGIICLWLIATYVFDWRETAAFAARGSIEDLGRAIARLSRTADFWLWFYLAFTVANTMFPSHWHQPSRRRKSALALAIGALILVLWWFGGEVAASISLGIENLAGSLAMVLLHVILIDAVVVIALGALESLTERITGKSATFVGGKMITMSLQEAQTRKASPGRGRKTSQREQRSEKTVEAIRSIYDLQLPIPGPPGREPVSRSIAGVVNLSADEPDNYIHGEPRSKPTSSPRPPAARPARPSPDPKAPAVVGSAALVPPQDASRPAEAPQAGAMDTDRIESTDGENAPFSRPFVQTAPAGIADNRQLDDGDKNSSDAYFPRPFAIETRADDGSDIGDPDSDEETNDDAIIHRASQPRMLASKTRPAPKPSKRDARALHKSQRLDGEELSYEPLDDEDPYADDEERQDADLPSS